MERCSLIDKKTLEMRNIGPGTYQIPSFFVNNNQKAKARLAKPGKLMRT